VTLETLAESNAFSIHYDNPDPRIAQAVAHELLGLFMDYNSRTRHERAAGTYRFLLSESSKLSNSIRDMESQLADFKTRYGDALPQAESRNLQALDAAERSYESTQAQIRLAQERVSMLSLQLDDLSPSLEGAVTDRRTQIATMRAELAEAQKRYTPEHPDVRRLRRAIQDLLAEDRAARSPGARVDNPQYLQVSSQLSAARRELAALRASAGRAADQVTQHSRSLRLTPSVEREYVQLARNYQLAQEHFRELQAKLTEAGLAQALVDEQQGERFMVVRDPALPRGPTARIDWASFSSVSCSVSRSASVPRCSSSSATRRCACSRPAGAHRPHHAGRRAGAAQLVGPAHAPQAHRNGGNRLRCGRARLCPGHHECDLLARLRTIFEESNGNDHRASHRPDEAPAAAPLPARSRHSAL
jgi:hypothetical protein